MEKFSAIFPDEPKWRFSQIEGLFFNPKFFGWPDVLNLTKNMREKLAKEIKWTSAALEKLNSNEDKSAHKALLRLPDGEKIETVLIKNSRGQWSVCVSSQVGCAMGCVFCATGEMGFKRNLTGDEIADQLRFWQGWMPGNGIKERVSNIVIMGMGEPLANYENVKTAVQQWLKYADIGGNHITVSTVGLLPQLNKILEDKDWPPVRLAVSLHSADENNRRKIVPSTAPGFLPDLEVWAKKYLAAKGNRKKHLTFEYVLLGGVNDSARDAKKLAGFAIKTGRIKINVIPCNPSGNSTLRASDNLAEFMETLEKCGAVATVRRSLGGEIQAACGQLAAKTSS